MKSTITVTGQGKMSGTPDLAVLQITVTNESDKPATVRKVNNAAGAKLVLLLKTVVAENDLYAVPARVHPKYEWTQVEGGESKQKLVGYIATNTMTAKVRDLDQLEDLVQKINELDPETTQITSFQFAIDKSEDLNDKARIIAFDQAKAKAELYAKHAGMKVGKVKTLQETYCSGGTRHPSGKMRALSAMESVDNGGGESIEMGDIEVQVTIQVTFKLK